MPPPEGLVPHVNASSIYETIDEISLLSGGTYVGGMEIVVQGLMETLNRLGHQTLAIVSGWNNGDYPARLQTSGITFEEVSLGRFYRSKLLWTLDTLRKLPSAALRLRRIVDEFCPDSVVYPETQILLMGSIILPKLNSVLYLHNKPSGLLVSRFAGVVNKRADRVVCVSNYVAACLGETSLDTKKIVVVHNGIESPSICLEKIQNQTVRLGIVGQIIARKQHLLLIEALGRLKTRSLEFPFTLKIIGKKEGQYAQKVAGLVEQLNLQEVVEWVGFRGVRDDIYRDLDIVVAVATEEPFGTTVLEAGAYGIPVVAARAGGFPEMVIDGVTGLLFDAGEVASLAAALEKLIADTSLRNRLGRAGRVHVGQTFTLERMAYKFLEAAGCELPEMSR